MSIFKRLSTTLSAHIDHIVGELENHDALIKATLKDLHKKVAEANVRLTRVQTEAAQLHKQSLNLRSDANRWRKRAVDCAQTDEQKALDCVSRARYCDQQVVQLEQTYEQYQLTIEKLTQDVNTAEQRVRDIKQQHSLMRARQSTYSAISATQNSSNDDLEMLNDTFERWEIKLCQAESMLESQPKVDRLEMEFSEQENTNDLKNELAILIENSEMDKSGEENK